MTSFAALRNRVRPTSPSVRRRWRAALFGLVTALIVGAAVSAAVLLQPPEYEGRVGLIAVPTPEVPLPPNSQSNTASFGEVVSLALPALSELATTPSALEATAAAVPGAPSPEDIGASVAVEQLPGSGVVRLSVRAPTPEQAGALTMALARQVAGTNTLAPIARLELLDDQATITQTAPNITFGVGLALLAGIVAGVGVGFFLLPYRARRSAGETVLAAVKEAGRSPVAVLHADDPLFSHRVAALQQAAARPLRVVPLGPELDERTAHIRGSLAEASTPLSNNGGSSNAAVLAVADRKHTTADEIVAAVEALPSRAKLVAVVLI